MTPAATTRFLGAGRRWRGAAALLGSAIVVAACGSAPPIHLHSLFPAEPPARLEPGAGAARQPMVIALAPIGVPAQVDQPQWLVRLGDGSLASLEQERWASPLGTELRQALVERLAVRHGIVEAQGAAAAPSARVDITLLRFDSAFGREALVEGSWLIQGLGATRDGPPLRCAWTLHKPASGGFQALAEAHRRIVGRLADAIAMALREGGSSRCPNFADGR